MVSLWLCWFNASTKGQVVLSTVYRSNEEKRAKMILVNIVVIVTVYERFVTEYERLRCYRTDIQIKGNFLCACVCACVCVKTHEPAHDKTYKIACAPSED